MAYIRVYDSRINWENYPSENTPINENNLNKMDYALFEHDKSLEQIFNNAIKRIDFNTTTKVLLITYWDNSTESISLAEELLPATFSLDSNGVVHMIDNHGNEYTADLKEHIYYIENVDIEDEGTATATTFTRKNIIINEASYELPGTKYMEQSVTLSDSENTEVIFANNIFLDSQISVDVSTTIPDLLYDSISITNNECHIVYAQQDSQVTAVVRVYIK